MSTLYKTILECFIKPSVLKRTSLEEINCRNSRNHVELENLYVGSKVEAKFSDGQFTDTQKVEFKKRCLDFYVELTEQIYLRFPFNSTFVKSLKLLNFLNPKKISEIATLGPLLNHFPHFIDDVNELDREWRLLRNMNLDFNEEVFAFWENVFKIRKGDDTFYFPNLTKLVSQLLVLPHSSAAVERIFSQVNLNKTKLRNRLENNTLTGLLHTKRLIGDKRCFDYDINSEIIKRHCGRNMY